MSHDYDDAPPGDDARAEAAVLRSMVLLSTLSTAADVWHAAEERRAGRDPTTQEADAVVAPFLDAARRELQARVMRLRASLVYARHHDEAAGARLVRRFDDLMAVRRVARLLHLVHQRLLSLYPRVSEGLVEEVRTLEAVAGAVLDAGDDDVLDALGPFADRALRFSARLERELAGDG